MSKTSTLSQKSVSGINLKEVSEYDFSNVYLYLEHMRSDAPAKTINHIMQFCRSYKVLGINKNGIFIN